eukprot:COSAG02_NODE_13544_length_1380_cov_6.505747_1_plen_334_part_10
MQVHGAGWDGGRSGTELRAASHLAQQSTAHTPQMGEVAASTQLVAAGAGTGAGAASHRAVLGGPNIPEEETLVRVATEGETPGSKKRLRKLTPDKQVMGEREASWQEVRHVCQEFPSAHDFMVTVEDVPAVLAKLAVLADEEPPTEADISVVVQHLDPSGSGFIAHSGIARLWCDSSAVAPTRPQESAPKVAAPQLDDIGELLFQALDRDRNGIITRAEMKDAIRGSPSPSPRALGPSLMPQQSPAWHDQSVLAKELELTRRQLDLERRELQLQREEAHRQRISPQGSPPRLDNRPQNRSTQQVHNRSPRPSARRSNHQETGEPADSPRTCSPS